MNEEKLYEVLNELMHIEFAMSATLSIMEILDEHYESKEQLELQNNIVVLSKLLSSLQKDLHKNISEFDGALIGKNK